MKSKLLILFFLGLMGLSVKGQVTITINPSVHYQTIEGWGDGGDLFSMLNFDTAVGEAFNRQTLDFLIDEYGLTGSRIWEVGPRIDGTGMDNGNCDSKEFIF